jgi:hypothetical protein
VQSTNFTFTSGKNFTAQQLHFHASENFTNPPPAVSSLSEAKNLRAPHEYPYSNHHPMVCFSFLGGGIGTNLCRRRGSHTAGTKL